MIFFSEERQTVIDKKINPCYLSELNAVLLLDYFQYYRQNWTIRLHCVNGYGIPIQMKNYTDLMEKDPWVDL